MCKNLTWYTSQITTCSQWKCMAGHQLEGYLWLQKSQWCFEVYMIMLMKETLNLWTDKASIKMQNRLVESKCVTVIQDYFGVVFGANVDVRS